MASNEAGEIARELRAKLELYSASGVDECLVAKRSLGEINADIESCTRCELSGSRSYVSRGAGTGSSGLFIVVERPFAGAEETDAYAAYGGEEGEFLKEIMTKGLKLAPDEVYLSFVTRCSPADAPGPGPIASCLPYLLEELSVLGPKVVLCFGSVAAEAVLGATVGLPPGSIDRNRLYTHNGMKVVATYGLTDILTDRVKKGEFWNGPFRQGGIL